MSVQLQLQSHEKVQLASELSSGRLMSDSMLTICVEN
jgi:hypothetical protein